MQEVDFTIQIEFFKTFRDFKITLPILNDFHIVVFPQVAAAPWRFSIP